MTVGFRVSQAIHVVAALGVADLIEDEPVSPGRSRRAAPVRRRGPGAGAAGAGGGRVFVETDDGRFAHSPMSEALRSDHPRSVRPTAVLIGQEHLWETWGTLMHSVRTGENAFVGRYGTDVWTYRTSAPSRTPSSTRRCPATPQRWPTSSAGSTTSPTHPPSSTSVAGTGRCCWASSRATRTWRRAVRPARRHRQSPGRPGARRRGRGSGALPSRRGHHLRRPSPKAATST